MALIEQNDDSQEVVNIAAESVRLNIGGMRVTLKQGDRMRVHKNYAFPRHFRQDRDPLPSVVELESGGRVVPITDKRAQAFLRSQKVG